MAVVVAVWDHSLPRHAYSSVEEKLGIELRLMILSIIFCASNFHENAFTSFFFSFFISILFVDGLALEAKIWRIEEKG